MSDNHKIVPAPEVSIQQEKMHPLVNAALRGGNIDTDQMSKLMDLQERWEQGQAKKAYTQAMVDLKAHLPSVLNRDGSVSFGEGRTAYTFTTLATAMDAISPHLTQFGFSLSWTPLTTQNAVSVTCRLTHVEGHYEETTLTAPPDKSGSKNAVQAIGSTISYLQRYTALSLLGIATKDMRSTDELQTPEKAAETVDSEKNLKAVTYLQSVGITVSEAENYVQNDVKSWTSADLANLREWYKEKKAANREKAADVALDGLRRAVMAEALKLWGQDDHLVKLAEMCRACPGGGFSITSATESEGKWVFEEISDRLAAREAERGA